MRKAFGVLLIAAVPISGCMNDNYVRRQPPLETYQSQLSADAAVSCLTHFNYTATTLKLSFVAQTLTPGSEYYVVPAGWPEPFPFSVEVKSSGSGSTLRLFQGTYMFPSQVAAMKAAALSCLTT